jgi:hypothetical protein
MFLGSVQLISPGIIGEYICLIFLEAKRRPTYIVAEYKEPPSECGALATGREVLDLGVTRT